MDKGKSVQEVWSDLINANDMDHLDLPEECPEVALNLFIACKPKLLPNQRAITLLASKLAATAYSWTYIC